MRVMLVEDDERVVLALSDVLLRHGYSVLRARSIAQALNLLDDQVDLVLLDLGLPDGDGFALCTAIREVRDVPIIITTARSDLKSRIHGLHLGADDYIVKPYAVSELLARMYAVARRSRLLADPDAQRPVVSVLGIDIDRHNRVVSRDGTPIPLTRKEYGILEVLAAEPGMVVRRERLLSQVWGIAWDGNDHTLDVHIAAVRSKVGVPDLIETVRGIGYRLAGR